MNKRIVEQIARATLYEGYMLYPYRPSSVKNQQRFNFGVLYPRSYSEEQGGPDGWIVRTECLLLSGSEATLEVRVRFLHLVDRQLGTLLNAPEGAGAAFDYELVESLTVDDRVLRPWQEAVEAEASVPLTRLLELGQEKKRLSFSYPAVKNVEPISSARGEVVGVVVRRQEAINAAIELVAQPEGGGLSKLSVTVLNYTPFAAEAASAREAALLRSMVSTHTIMGVADAEFISLLDPPEAFRSAAAACSNVGTWPVLVGDNGARDT